MYKFLVTNDDGIFAPGLLTLIKSLSGLGVVYVVAPKEQQSAKSMSLTFRTTVQARQVELDDAEVAYEISGTPADCVKWAMDTFNDFVDFDFLISGVNNGANISTGIYYSGTVSAAREASFQGLRSIALSVDNWEAESFDYICTLVPELLEMSSRLGPETILNVNAPDIPAGKIKGVRLAEPAPHSYGDTYHFTDVGNGEYQMSAHFTEIDPELKNDYNFIREGYVTITPINSSVIDRAAMRKLKKGLTGEPLCIIIDAQSNLEDTVRKPSKWRANMDKWTRCIDRLDLPVLVAERVGLGRGLKQIEDNVDRLEKVIRTEFDAMESTKFSEMIDSVAGRRVYVAGLETHVSVQMTAMHLLDDGFDVVIIENCCSSGSKEEHRTAIDNLRGAGCTIATYESAVMELMGDTGHKAYKSIMKILND